jgi:hypothetical protein
MVPFSFPQPLLKSRVIMRQLMVESLELRAASVTSVTLDPIGGERESREVVKLLIRKSQFVNRKS